MPRRRDRPEPRDARRRCAPGRGGRAYRADRPRGGPGRAPPGRRRLGRRADPHLPAALRGRPPGDARRARSRDPAGRDDGVARVRRSARRGAPGVAALDARWPAALRRPRRPGVDSHRAVPRPEASSGSGASIRWTRCSAGGPRPGWSRSARAGSASAAASSSGARGRPEGSDGGGLGQLLRCRRVPPGDAPVRRRSRSSPSAPAAASRDGATPTRPTRRFGRRGCATSRSRSPGPAACVDVTRPGAPRTSLSSASSPATTRTAPDERSWSCRPVSCVPDQQINQASSTWSQWIRVYTRLCSSWRTKAPQRSERAASCSASARSRGRLERTRRRQPLSEPAGEGGLRRSVHLRLPGLCETINSIVADRSTRRKRATLRDLAAATGPVPGRRVVCAPRPTRLVRDRGPRARRGGPDRVPVRSRSRAPSAGARPASSA